MLEIIHSHDTVECRLRRDLLDASTNAVTTLFEVSNNREGCVKAINNCITETTCRQATAALSRFHKFLKTVVTISADCTHTSVADCARQSESLEKAPLRCSGPLRARMANASTSHHTTCS